MPGQFDEAWRRQLLWQLACHIRERMGASASGLQRIPKARLPE